MDLKSFDILKKMPIEEIMKVGNVKLIKPVSSKRENEEEFSFIFEVNTFTDPEWRSIFFKQYSSGKAAFKGSNFSLICKPTDLDSEVMEIKRLIGMTNEEYSKQREGLIKKLESEKEVEKNILINKNIEENQVSEMFKNFRV